jgi:hypothetical protein
MELRPNPKTDWLNLSSLGMTPSKNVCLLLAVRVVGQSVSKGWSKRYDCQYVMKKIMQWHKPLFYPIFFVKLPVIKTPKYAAVVFAKKFANKPKANCNHTLNMKRKVWYRVRIRCKLHIGHDCGEGSPNFHLFSVTRKGGDIYYVNWKVKLL